VIHDRIVYCALDVRNIGISKAAERTFLLGTVKEVMKLDPRMDGCSLTPKWQKVTSAY
jgi:hypothetical protein